MIKGIWRQLIAAAAMGILLVGCSTYEGEFVPKTEEQLAQMEVKNDEAHAAFLAQNYSEAEKKLKELSQERTVSLPLYQMEMISLLLMQGRNDEAHAMMEALHQDIETLFDEKMADKALSVWHGEVNKVFKGDAYERATFYAMMALSYLRQKNYDDAIRSVKNGLLADADSNNPDAIGDYPLLYYIGYLASKKKNDQGEAAEYWRFLVESLAMRGIRLYDQNGKALLDKNCFEHWQKRNPNVLLIVWSGLPPTVLCGGEYNHIRSIIRGANPFHAMNVSVNNAALGFLPNNLGDVEYQAITRGGRLMDNVLNDKATAKKTMEVTRNVMFVVGTGLIVAGSRSMGAMPVGLSLMGAGVGCYVVGGTAWIIGNMMNPAADARYWRNLPGQFYIVPLELPAGKHTVRLTGYRYSDQVFNADFPVEVTDAQAMQVLHLPMMTSGEDFIAAARGKLDEERINAISKASYQRMSKELK